MSGSMANSLTTPLPGTPEETLTYFRPNRLPHPALPRFWPPSDPTTTQPYFPEATYSYAAVNTPAAAGPYRTATSWLA